MKTYTELKRKKDEIQSMLSAHSDLRGHRTYKKLEDELHSIKKQIKQFFREQHNARNTNIPRV